MKLTGLHLLLTFACTFECDHCFVWGSPWQSGTMTLKDVRHILDQADALGSVESIYFEGGEPTLYYPILVKAVQESRERGFSVGIVSNAYWATSAQDALEWLRPFAGLVEDFSISSDLYHYSEKLSQQARNAAAAAQELEIPLGVISIAQPEATETQSAIGQLPVGESTIIYRGRAAEKLASRARHQPWESFVECPYEDLRDPGRLHVDPLGHLHICQGISLGNMLQESLVDIWERYDPEAHPITGPLLTGGPAALVERYHPPHQESYADACHLCDHARRALRERFPDILAPDQVYGILVESPQ
jgi:MoaA/NifB/PqqE/SkfB family radical SAM enzyme